MRQKLSSTLIVFFFFSELNKSQDPVLRNIAKRKSSNKLFVKFCQRLINCKPTDPNCQLREFASPEFKFFNTYFIMVTRACGKTVRFSKAILSSTSSIRICLFLLYKIPGVILFLPETGESQIFPNKTLVRRVSRLSDTGP